jgi:hypothetical protein
MLKTADGLEPWGQVRWMEFAIALQWFVVLALHFLANSSNLIRLYEYHPQGNEDMLMETMHLLQQTGQDWSNVFTESVSAM